MLTRDASLTRPLCLTLWSLGRICLIREPESVYLKAFIEKKKIGLLNAERITFYTSLEFKKAEDSFILVVAVHCARMEWHCGWLWLSVTVILV